MTEHVILRRLDIDRGEILTRDQLPRSAVATGRDHNGFPEYVYTTTNPDLIDGYLATLDKYFGR
jgi:hypothetical protein